MNAETDTPDAGDPEQVEQARAKALHRERAHRAVCAQVLAHQDGRDWLWGLMGDFLTLDKRVLLGDTGYGQGFADGQREGGLRILRLCARSSPTDFATMLKEHDRG